MQNSKPLDGHVQRSKNTTRTTVRQTGDISIKTRDKDNVEFLEAKLWVQRKEVGRVFE